MRKGLFTLLSLVCAGLIWAAPAPANAADKIVIRFAHSNTPSDMDPYHALVTKMNDKLVKKLGADRIEIQEFPAGQIGSEERSFQDVQQGILQMTVLAVNNASIFAPSLGAFDLPYIFKSVKVINGMKTSGKKRDNLGSIGKSFRRGCNSIAESATKKEGNQPSFFVGG